MTLLHECCVRDMRNRMIGPHRESAAVLLDAGANISARDEEYRSTPLAWATRRGRTQIVDMLRKAGAR